MPPCVTLCVLGAGALAAPSASPRSALPTADERDSDESSSMQQRAHYESRTAGVDRPGDSAYSTAARRQRWRVRVRTERVSVGVTIRNIIPGHDMRWLLLMVRQERCDCCLYIWCLPLTKCWLAVSFCAVLEEGGVKMKLTVIDTPGFGDQINNDNWWVLNMTSLGLIQPEQQQI